MRPNTDSTSITTLTPRQRLTRGLSNTASGPVDMARGAIGLGVQSARSGATRLRTRYRESRLAHEVAGAPQLLARELAAAQGAVAALPQALQEARRAPRRRWRPAAITGVAAMVLFGGTVTVVLIRRSAQAQPVEPSPRPPSVDVQPKP